MKIETLKKLIEYEYERHSSNTFKFKTAVEKLLDLYEEDTKASPVTDIVLDYVKKEQKHKKL